MASDAVFLCVVFCLAGLFLCWIGNRIRKKQAIKSVFLPGLTLKEVKDQQGLATFLGSGLVAMGVISILMGGSIFILPPLRVWVLLTLLIALIANCIRLVLGIRKYQSR